MYDWHHSELNDRPPYGHIDMVYMLAEGRFLIEGKRSDFTDAEMFCQAHPYSTDAWAALNAVEAGLNKLALTGEIY